MVSAMIKLIRKLITNFFTEQVSSEDRKTLLRICGGSQETLNRLVDAEKRRTPSISDAKAYRNAIESWQRDNR